MNQQRFTDRNIVVTGGGMGIGAQCALRLGSEGAHVIIADRNEAAANEVAKSIRKDGGKATVTVVDVSSRDNIERWATSMDDIADSLHGLINNAGVVRPAAIAELSDELWDLQVDINLKAPVTCTNALIDRLIRGTGHIVNISSEGGFNARPRNCVYDATKAAMGAVTRAMACEYVEHGIRVNEIAPGPVVTEMHTLQAEDPDRRKEELLALDFQKNILGRYARPEEIAAVVVFLLTDDASYLTGATLHADGGMVAK